MTNKEAWKLLDNYYENRDEKVFDYSDELVELYYNLKESCSDRLENGRQLDKDTMELMHELHELFRDTIDESPEDILRDMFPEGMDDGFAIDTYFGD